ncbi:cation diffusion facilitator family transporter [Acetivibrio straminisolvens]|uniref:Cobalt-zinc-cadmium resistance protein n=1 Tax=Acetivibrio straminisolvens JCM 21531 TaxID=1294263 RepID=W4V2U3_9FIRM|nr:cation diffusion facilitator family transporter [Acetivibrio straminisolvens]GAE87153.1 cobalt-zinc-cadmium resistance protein [Acetivibrio straminisolvens JCM 21531]
MIKLIIKWFIKDYRNVTDKKIRESYGVLSGVIGIICNIFLFILKIITGLFINSIAVISDAFNNLSDLGSSLVAIFGVKLSNRPPDDEHPHGHGRYEYISSLVVSFIIFAVGLELLRNSFGKIVKPEEVTFNAISILMLIISILVKLWMFSYNRYIGGVINSGINKATAQDSLNDAIATTAVLAGTLIGRAVPFPLDGIMGLIISVLIMYTGFGIAKDSVDLLLGLCPDEELTERIKSYFYRREIKGIHDLKVHDYGPGRISASIHAEVSEGENIVEIHSVIDEIEQRIKNELGVDIVVHMDPVGDKNESSSEDKT